MFFFMKIHEKYCINQHVFMFNKERYDNKMYISKYVCKQLNINVYCRVHLRITKRECLCQNYY